MEVTFIIDDKPVERDLSPIIGICSLGEVSSDYLAGWRQLLAEPYLVDQSIAIETFVGIFLAVPIGVIRRSGNFDFGCEDPQAVVDILKDKPGFPNVRIRHVSGISLVEWGEDPLKSSNREQGEWYGYCSEEIQKFDSDKPYDHPLRTLGRRI